MIASKGACEAAELCVFVVVVVAAAWVRSVVDEDKRSVALISPVAEFAAAWTCDAEYNLYIFRDV
jgi:hypothetical protein